MMTKSESERANPSTGQAGTGRGDVPAAGPRVCGLSSARDRARLREREQAERARVERVLARGPRGLERRRRERGEAAVCRVCGGHEVVQDEVSERGVFRLARCLRCEHRWTERGSDGFAPAVRRTLHRADNTAANGTERPRHANGA